MFLPLPQGFPSSPGYLLLAWRDREAGAKGSEQCAEPWIFLKAHLKRILKMKAYNFQCFWGSKEVANGNGLKPQPGFVHGFTVVSIYCVQGKNKKKQKPNRWCSNTMVLAICGSSTVWLALGRSPRPLSFPSCTGRCYWWSLLPVIPQPVLGSGSAYLLRM